VSPTDLQAKRKSSMSQETMLRELFDRWERVWHEGQYDLISECIPLNYIRHDEAGDRTVTREAYAAEIAKTRQERPHLRFVVYITRSRATARGSALPSSGLTRTPARRKPGQACRFTASRLASSRRLG